MNQTYYERAKRGADLLDEKGPKGWRRKVVERGPLLDMMDPSNCVLARIYGTYWRGLLALFGEKYGNVPGVVERGFIGGAEEWNALLGVEEYEAVKRGIALLDEIGPKGWRDKLATRGPLTADDMQGSTCVLGRLYGGYLTGKAALGLKLFEIGIDRFDVVSYGFAGQNWEALAYWWNELVVNPTILNWGCVTGPATSGRIEREDNVSNELLPALHISPGAYLSVKGRDIHGRTTAMPSVEYRASDGTLLAKVDVSADGTLYVTVEAEGGITYRRRNTVPV